MIESKGAASAAVGTQGGEKEQRRVRERLVSRWGNFRRSSIGADPEEARTEARTEDGRALAGRHRPAERPSLTTLAGAQPD